jgi:hypothetical protein
MRTASTLYACSNELTGFALGASSDDGHEFIAKLHLSEVRGPLACPAAPSGGLCAAEWPGIAERLGISPEELEARNLLAPDGGPPALAASAPASGCSLEAGGAARGSRQGSCLALLATLCFIAGRVSVRICAQEPKAQAGRRSGRE